MKLDYDGYRDIRFRKDQALLGAPFKMEMFHPGFLFTRPVRISVVKNGVAEQVPYAAAMFEYGKNRFDPPLPRDLGFAGFRIHYPLNRPGVDDELIVFLGIELFSVPRSGQHYGLSARGIAIGSGEPNEKFPEFTEFWIEQPDDRSKRITIWALLDGPSLAGAYQFVVYPGEFTTVDTTVTLYPRREIERLGIAPLTSMFFFGENDRRRRRLPARGARLRRSAAELRRRRMAVAPARQPAGHHRRLFLTRTPRGFGLIQRDRDFDAPPGSGTRAELRPSAWIAPRGDWGDGTYELVEIPAEHRDRRQHRRVLGR